MLEFRIKIAAPWIDEEGDNVPAAHVKLVRHLEMAGPRSGVILAWFEHDQKRPDFVERFDEPAGIDLLRRGKVVASIDVPPGWELFSAVAGKWDVRMVVCEKGAIPDRD